MATFINVWSSTLSLVVACNALIQLFLLIRAIDGAPATTNNYAAEVKHGDSVQLNCQFNPKEQQFLRWETDEGLAIDTRRQTSYKITDDYHLHIRNTTLSEVGQYHCVVRELKPPHKEDRIKADKLALSVTGLENIGDGSDPNLKENKSSASTTILSATVLLCSLLALMSTGLY